MYRVLIADDEMPALRYTRNIIQQFCSQFQIVDAVISGEAALKVLQAQAIDLLITDISMHGMSGIELAQSAKNSSRIFTLSSSAAMENLNMPREPSRPVWTSMCSSPSALPK